MNEPISYNEKGFVGFFLILFVLYEIMLKDISLAIKR